MWLCGASGPHQGAGERFRAYSHVRPSRANFFAPKLLAARQDETVNTNVGSSARLRETHDAFAHQDCAENGCFCLAMVSSVSPKTERAPAKVMTVSRKSPTPPVGHSTSRVTQKSHIISLGHFSRPPENVAIPTIDLQYLNKSLGNYVRNCSDGGKTPAKQISHAIRVCEVSIKSENVAIPTISFQDLKELWGNCMRNWGAQQRCARGPRQGPRAVAGPGRASRRRAERSSRRGRLAGGPPPTGTHSGRGLRRPEHPWRHKQHNNPGTPKGRVPKYPPLVGSLSHCLVEA